MLNSCLHLSAWLSTPSMALSREVSGCAGVVDTAAGADAGDEDTSNTSLSFSPWRQQVMLLQDTSMPPLSAAVSR